MEGQQVAIWLQNNSKFFPEGQTLYLKEKLSNLNDEQFLQCTTIELQNPTTILIISIFLGELGIDRFMVGDIGMGILKLLTCGCCGILWLIDIFTLGQKAKENNFNKINSILQLENNNNAISSNRSRNEDLLDSADLLLNYKQLVKEKIITQEQFDEYKEKIMKGKITQPIEISSIKKYKTLYEEKVISEEEYEKYIADAIQSVNVQKKKKTNLLKIEIYYIDGSYSREEIKASSENPSHDELQNELKENGINKEILKYNVLESRRI